MPKLAPHVLPSYRKHKKSGQAVVTLDGTDVYLGRHGSPESKESYRRATGEWLAGGRRLPRPETPLTVVELLAAFWKHATTYYRRPDGTATSEADNFRQAMVPLRFTHGRTTAADFGPLALKTVRDEMVRRGWCRTNVNKQTSRIRSIFRWAAENELVPASVHHALTAVAGLRRGRSAAPEPEPVKPAPDALVDAALAHASPQIAGMIRLQRLTGMRPGEVCAMRSGDVDRTGDVWIYRPAAHKNQHHGHDRAVPLGPKARAVIEPLLKADPTAHVFDPRDAESARRTVAAAARKTPLSCGNRAGTNRKAKPARTVGECYDVDAYRRAITRACDAAFPPPAHLAAQRVNGRRWETTAEQRGRLGPERWAELEKWRGEHRWHPHQLRHSAATAIRRDFGIEAAQVVLGHRTLKVTEIYAEKNVAAAARIMALVG